MTISPYDTQDVELLKEIQAAAESRLEAQLTAALSSDQRALVFAGLLAASAAALVGGAASVLFGAKPDIVLCRIALGVAVGLVIAIICALKAAWATQWYFPGGRPENWLTDIRGGKNQLQRLAALAEDYNDRIVANDAAMLANAWWLNRAGFVAIASLAAGGLSLVAKYAVILF